MQPHKVEVRDKGRAWESTGHPTLVHHREAALEHTQTGGEMGDSCDICCALQSVVGAHNFSVEAWSQKTKLLSFALLVSLRSCRGAWDAHQTPRPATGQV